MAGSTYSTNLKLELMTTGENSGTWGDVTNTNLGTALEQAVVGYGNPDYASDANLTISITNSNASQAARALVLNVTSTFGSLTATRELVVPTIQKQYIVQNNTAGGQSITVKTSAGTGITVPNGRKAHLYVDGTNVIQMFDFVDINGGAIDGTPIGASSASTGAFTTLNASGATTLDGNVTLGNASGDTVTVTGTIASNLLFTDNTYDIGASGATRPRNLYLAGAATIGGNLSVGGTLTLTGGLTLNGNVTVGDSAADTLTINSTVTSNLIFTDNTYDIGASGATRPRNLFIAGNITAGGSQTLTGSLTVDSTTDSSSTTTGSIQTDGGVGIAKALYVGTTANIAGAVTLSGGTANGVMYLNGSKQITTGTALSFDGTTFGVVGRLYNGDASTFGASTWGMSLGNGGVSANYFKASTTYWQNNAGTQILQLSAGAMALAGSANAIYSGVGTTGWSGFAVDTTGGNAIFGVDDSTGSTFGTEAYATIVKSTSKPIYFKNGNTTIGSWNTTSLAVVGAGSYTGNVTIGNASAATNVALNLNGVVNKAQRIVFQNSGVEQWLIGAGAASETSAFEIYNSNGTMELSINKSTSVATFAGGTLSVTGTGSRGVRLTGKGVGEVAIGGDGTTYVLGHNFYNTTAYSTELGGLYVYTAGGAYQYLAIGPSYNSQNSLYVNASGNVGIGFSTAAQKLDINGALRFTPNTADTNYSADIFANYDSGHPFQINVKNNGTTYEMFGVYADGGGGNERAVFPTGNVGMGTNGPASKLTLYGVNTNVNTTVGSSNQAMLLLISSNTASTNYGPEIVFANTYSAPSTIVSASIAGTKTSASGSGSDQYDGNLLFKTSSYPNGLQTKMTIQSDGNIIYPTNSDGGGTNVYQLGTAIAKFTMNDNNGSVVSAIKMARFPATGGGVSSGDGWVITTGANTYTPYGAASDDPTVAIQSRGIQLVKGGIQFGNAVGTWDDANSLDDYEEGTWTTTFNSPVNLTGTPSLNGATYTKIGRLVTVVGRITGYSITTSGAAAYAVPNLPFPMLASSAPIAGGVFAQFSGGYISGVCCDNSSGEATSFATIMPAVSVTATGAVTIDFSITYQTT